MFEGSVKPRFDSCLKGESLIFGDWFSYPEVGSRFMQVRYFPYYGKSDVPVGVVAMITDDTELKRKEEYIAARHGELERELRDLRDSSAMLKSTLERLVTSGAEFSRECGTMVRRMEPVLGSISESEMQAGRAFRTRLFNRFPDLTFNEIRVAELIIEGKTTQEIADYLKRSHKTIDFYRSCLRDKMALKGRKVNLKAFLSAI